MADKQQAVVPKKIEHEVPGPIEDPNAIQEGTGEYAEDSQALTVPGDEPKIKIVPYDKSLTQIFSFAKEDNDHRYILEFEIDKLDNENDSRLLEFDRLQEVIIHDDGDDRLLEVNNLEASVWYFDEYINLKSGFEGTLPENWKAQFDADGKQAVVNTLMGADIHVQSNVKTLAQFSFTKQKDYPIVLKANFNNQETLAEFIFPPKAPDHIHAYKKITGAAKFKRGREGTFMPNNWGELKELYNDIGVKCPDNVGLHLKVIALRDRYDATLREQTKKLNS